MPFDLGAVVPLGATVRDDSDALVNAGTITLKITLPDGTVLTPTVTNPPAVVGQYTYDYPTTMPGHHAVRWTSATPQSALTDSFDVSEETPGWLFSLKEAKSILHINASQTSYDDDIRTMIGSTTRAVEFHVGPVARQTIQEKHQGGSAIVLRRTPVMTVTSIVPVYTDGPSYSMPDIDIDPETGEMVLKSGVAFGGPVRVTFVAGRQIIPSNIRDAARFILKHLWAMWANGIRTFCRTRRA
jgi:hypothetical protein